MKKRLLRLVSLMLVLLFCLIPLTGCMNKSGKPLLTLKKDGITVSISANIYQLLLTRIKGSLVFKQQPINGMTANQSGYWTASDKFDGKNLQTMDEFVRESVLNDCRTYLAALYLFEKEGLTLSASAVQEIEDRLYELVRVDGNGSKTKLNQVLSTYGVNYDMLKELYLIEAKVAALQTYLYGEGASKLGSNIKDEFLEENYVHFRQILYVTYHYVFETDKNGDTIYYYSEGENKDRIYYDKYNGEKGVDKDGNTIKDENGDVVYYVKGTDQTKIAYDATNGMPSYVLTDDGSDVKTSPMTDEELAAVKEKANSRLADLQGATYFAFEAIMEEESDDMAEVSEYDDGYYLKKSVDYLAMGEDYAYLHEIVTKLDEMNDGDVTLVQSTRGYHIIMKYPHTEKAYEKESNETWFEDFADSLINEVFLEKCNSYFDAITLDEKVYATVPSMKEIAVNFYY